MEGYGAWVSIVNPGNIREFFSIRDDVAPRAGGRLIRMDLTQPIYSI